jgi:DNA-binding NarL/FixJ family response regulator
VSIRVLIADDQSLVRAGFRLVLENHPDMEVVGEASNGREAVYSAVAGGEALLAPTVTRRLIEEFARVGRSPRVRPPELDELTPRELEVLTLLARGLSNAEIAAELVLGETTVKTHVTHVLGKLGLRDRVQAVVLAYESGLVTPGG